MDLNLLHHSCGCRRVWRAWVLFWGCSNQKSLALSVALSSLECSHFYQLVRTNVVSWILATNTDLLILILDFLWLPVFIRLYGNISALHISLPQAFWGSWGLPFRCPFISFRPGLLCGCQPSGVSECAGPKSPSGLCGGVITMAVAASVTSVLLSWRFAASVELSTTLLALTALQWYVTSAPLRKSCSCCFQNLIPVAHLISPSK